MRIFKLLNVRYHDFLNATQSYLSKTLSDFGSNYGNSTVFGQLINVLSETVQSIMLYIEDALTEQNKYTAQRKKSLWSLAQLTGYDPSFGRAATAQVYLSYLPHNEGPVDVIINNHEPLTCTQNGLQYNLVLPQEAVVISIEKDNTCKEMGIVEGKFESQTFVSTGGKLYTQGFTFSGNLDIDYLSVKINNVVWDRCASLYDMDADGLQYTTKPGMDGKLNIIFGNDVHGRSLKEGDVINITYLIHNGEGGNINVNEGVDFSFNKPLMTTEGDNVNGDMMFNISLLSNDSVSSGADSETSEEIRRMIGLNSRSLVLADPNNYKNFINKFSFCGYNRTWSEKGSLVVNSLIIKDYKNMMKEGRDYFKLKEDDFMLSEEQKSSVLNSLDASGTQLAGVSYNIFNPQLCKYAATMYITMKKKSYDGTYITNQIRDLVGKFFSDVENDMFIPKSDIVNLIKTNVPGVDSVDVYFISERNETAIKTRQYTDVQMKFNPSTGTYDKKIENVYLYDGENPGIGLDRHGNIQISSDEQFPVLMGGWSYVSHSSEITGEQTVMVMDPLTIIFE